MSWNSKLDCWLELREQGEEEELRSGRSGDLSSRSGGVGPYSEIGKPCVLEGCSECSTENKLREGKNGRRENQLGDFL